MTTSPGSASGGTPSASERMRALDDRLKRGSISRSAYEAEKLAILRPERPTIPARPPTTAGRTVSRGGSPPVLAYLLITTAICALLSHFLWWQRVETFASGTMILLPKGLYFIELSLTLAIAVATGWAGYTVFRHRTITWPVFGAMPLLLTCTIRGFAALSIGTLNGSFGGGAFASLIMTGCAIASVIIVFVQYKRDRWDGFEFSSPVSTLGLVASFTTLIVFFGNGWSGVLTQTGSRWVTATMWFTWASILALISALGTPLISGLSRDRRLSLWLAIGGVLELLGNYGSLIWLGIDGTLVMTNLVLFLGASIGLLIAIAVIQIRELRSERESFATLTGPV